ncbi:unnamed protein product (macronuclear) [Paramecium tetraurelia]|uniref:Uncharacterized protein n=1 Tax=Paramecium tetraurelia TaxID=5888 RepID=A0E200_PARTE|nr:uncharacterized protein GSPATT00022488001 [Paramecium tetraurelia]CAK89317.1 unnamed protein product [Paramecium tetraurelia]|eukprot:XP_001456714.1 hypothetical protein (macronuclear) [Paramecium tetraurelia strain d4-2]
MRVQTLTDEYLSPVKLPSVQQINKTIQGEDGTIFAMNQLMSRANIGTSNKAFRTLQKITNDQSERKDLQLLQQWTDSMVQQIQKQHFYSITEFYDKMELIYSGSIGQLCQQLSVKCNDYSQLIDKIWTQFTGTVKEIIDKQSRTNRKLEKESLAGTIKIHERYQNSMTEKVQRLQEAEKQLKRNTEYVEKLNKENKYLRKKTNTYQTQITSLNNDIELLKLQLQDLNKENETYKLFQQVRHSTENVTADYEEELYKAKKEIFDDFKLVFEEQTRKFEEAYHNKMLELERGHDDKAQKDENLMEEYEEILFKDKCVGNHMDFADSQTDTIDLIQTQDCSVQTIHQKKKIYDQGTQTLPPQQCNQACEANYAINQDRECIPRNSEEQTYLEMSRYPIKAFIDDYYQLYIEKVEIEKKTFPNVFESVLDQLKFRSSQLFNIMKMKEEFFSDDFYESSYSVFVLLTHHFQDIIQKLKDELVARKIQIFETQIDFKQAVRQKNQNQKRFEILSNKYQQQVKNYNFIEKQFKSISRFIPQYHQDQIRRKAQKHKIHLEFPKAFSPIPNAMMISTNNLNNLNPPAQQAFMNSSTTLLPPQHQSTSPNLLLTGNPKNSFGFFPPMTPLEHQESSIPQRNSLIELSCDSPEPPEQFSPQKTTNHIKLYLFNYIKVFPDNKFEESSSSSEEEVDLSECLNSCKESTVNRKEIVCEQMSKQKYFDCNSNSFIRDSIIQKRQNRKYCNSNFASWCLKFNKFNYPMHVQLYEYFSSENQSQPQNVWLGKVARVIKSVIYYKRKNDSARLFHAMLVGDLSFLIYLQILSTISNVNFQDTGISILQSQLADQIKSVQRLPQYIDYDQEISHHLGPMQDIKIQELLLKYSMILQIFADEGERLTQNQFRLIMLELENKKDEQYYINMFNSECDIEQSSIQYMSFQRFAVICEEFQLLQGLEEYLAKNDAQYFKDTDLWKVREIELKLMLIRSHNYDASERDLFFRMHKLHQPSQRIILGRFLERRAKELLLQKYTLECLAPFMLLFES